MGASFFLNPRPLPFQPLALACPTTGPFDPSLFSLQLELQQQLRITSSSTNTGTSTSTSTYSRLASVSQTLSPLSSGLILLGSKAPDPSNGLLAFSKVLFRSECFRLKWSEVLESLSRRLLLTRSCSTPVSPQSRALVSFSQTPFRAARCCCFECTNPFRTAWPVSQWLWSLSNGSFLFPMSLSSVLLLVCQLL